MSETLPEDDGTMRINGIVCRPEHMQLETLESLRDGCFDTIVQTLREIKLLNEVIDEHR